jgi:membrane protease subunit HflC
MSSIINAKIRGVLGKENLVNLISLDRTKLMNKITKEVAEEAKDFGINVIDVRIRRADLPSANSEAIFKRMQTERTREAKEFRAEGAELGQTIKSKADKEVTIILAEARKTSQILRGEGDGLRNKIFAEAFGRDPEFFSFYRAMQSYEKSLLSGGETSLVLSPDSEFFRYFGESGLHKILKK